MRFKIWLAFVVLFAGFPGLWTWASPGAQGADQNVSFWVEPLFQKGLGGTAYDLSAVDPTSGITALSRSEFPMVQLEAGILLGVSVNRDGQRQWLIEAGFSHSVLGLHGSMNDYDWNQVPGYPPVPWSYTYSTDSVLSWQASLEAAVRFASAGALSFYFYGSYRYQYASHVEDTLTGWQYVPGTTPGEYVPTVFYDPTTDVLEYTISTHAASLGFMTDLQILPRWSLELRSAAMVVSVSDRDDHKLRTKLSTASGFGPGAYVDLRSVFHLESIGTVRPYLALDGSVVCYYVSTTQTQYWYGNADAANGGIQGMTITGVGHVITSAQYQIGFRIGVAF